MDFVGIDLGKRQSDVCVVDSQGRVQERMRIPTTRAALSGWFGNTSARFAIESCRDSGWVHDHLKSLGHEVAVVDTTRVRVIGVGAGKRKTDRRDAEMLALSLIRGRLPEAHVLSPERRLLRDVLHARSQLVKTRTSLVVTLRGQVQARGLTSPSCAAKQFAIRLRTSGLPVVESPHIQSLLAVLDGISAQIQILDRQLEGMAEREEAYERLCSVPGVKLVVALAFIASLDDAARFRNAHQVQAYLGLVPSEYTTGGRGRLGRITRCGNPMARRLLVTAAHALLRTRTAQQDPLVVWAHQLAQRMGKKKAIVAVARRLAGVLWAMWVDGTFYDPQGLARASWKGLSRKARRSITEANAMQKLGPLGGGAAA